MADDGAPIVRSLLAAAGLTVTEEEFRSLVAQYAVLRAQADGLYLPELDQVPPAVSFDPREFVR
ncbi:hypothetical protein [Actinopolymorpha alba]|uniref:hypothetical protein n=1 Tax=Actinopolymorpha alba TaxID=533267 RepID=UPI00035EEE60|nr:hypothetical protein [Actinopolymorpha alba]